MQPEALVRTACPLVGELGWGFYFTPETSARAEELGLDVFSFYFLGRGGVLGDCEARVVHSAFGYFNPEVIGAMWEVGRKVITPRDAARAFFECCQAYGRQHFSSVADLGAYCEAAEAVVAATDPEGLPLFAGASAEPLPSDLPARAMQLTTVLRELRGSMHLVAVVASGVPTKSAHAISRPEMWEVFGWQDGDKPEITDDQRAAMAAAEELTDRLVLPSYAALDEAGGEAMVTVLRAMKAALEPAG